MEVGLTFVGQSFGCPMELLDVGLTFCPTAESYEVDRPR